jgi:hypothetical protein
LLQAMPSASPTKESLQPLSKEASYHKSPLLSGRIQRSLKGSCVRHALYHPVWWRAWAKSTLTLQRNSPKIILCLLLTHVARKCMLSSVVSLTEETRP